MKAVVSGVVLAVALAGCAEQVVQEQMTKTCARHGEKPFVIDVSDHLYTVSATALCVGRDDAIHMPPGFGVDVLWSPRNFAGLGILSVQPDSVADKAGVKTGDILYEFGGQQVSNPNDLSTDIKAATTGSEVPIRLERKKQKLTLTCRF